MKTLLVHETEELGHSLSEKCGFKPTMIIGYGAALSSHTFDFIFIKQPPQAALDNPTFKKNFDDWLRILQLRVYREGEIMVFS